MFFKVVGIVAAMLTTCSFVPQAAMTIRTKDTAGISLVMYLMFTGGVLLWLVYGIYLKDLALMLSNGVTLVLASIILSCKIRNIAKDKRQAGA
jgi:MtN3 and saliva related transmembrane protein